MSQSIKKKQIGYFRDLRFLEDIEKIKQINTISTTIENIFDLKMLIKLETHKKVILDSKIKSVFQHYAILSYSLTNIRR